MSVETIEVPTLVANDDDGYGWDVHFLTPGGDPILIAQGASITQSNNGKTTRITLRSDRTDFEGDSLYLLVADMVVGNTTWWGTACDLDGVLTEFLWRTEEQVTADLAEHPSGEDCYQPSGPLPEKPTDALARATTLRHGHPTKMLPVTVRIRSTRKEV